MTRFDINNCPTIGGTVTIPFEAMVPQLVLPESELPAGEGFYRSYNLDATFGAPFCCEADTPVLVVDGVLMERAGLAG
jgi:hypothetical protein